MGKCAGVQCSAYTTYVYVSMARGKKRNSVEQFSQEGKYIPCFKQRKCQSKKRKKNDCAGHTSQSEIRKESSPDSPVSEFNTTSETSIFNQLCEQETEGKEIVASPEQSSITHFSGLPIITSSQLSHFHSECPTTSCQLQQHSPDCAMTSSQCPSCHSTTNNLEPSIGGGDSGMGMVMKPCDSRVTSERMLDLEQEDGTNRHFLHGLVPNNPNDISKVLHEPCTPKVLHEPCTPKVLHEPCTPNIIHEVNVVHELQ